MNNWCQTFHIIQFIRKCCCCCPFVELIELLDAELDDEFEFEFGSIVLNNGDINNSKTGVADLIACVSFRLMLFMTSLEFVFGKSFDHWKFQKSCHC